MNEPKATRYQRRQQQARVTAWALVGLTLACVAFTGAGAWAYGFVGHLARLVPVAVQAEVSLVLFIALVTGLCELAVLPAVFYLSRTVEPAYGRSGEGSLRGRLLGSLALLPAVVASGLIVHLAGRIAGRAWWLAAGVLLSVALAVVVRMGPVILGRLGTVRPLARPELEARIAHLANQAGVPVAAIQEWQVSETSSTVAMVAGLGRGRRVLLATDVARHWSDDEVAVVVAHELAHHVHRDLLQSLGLNAAVLCAGLLAAELLLRAGVAGGGAGAADPAALPVIAFAGLLVWLLATPLRHAQSRRQERRADRFALTATGAAGAFVTAVRRASARRLADERPTPLTRWLFHRHPSVVERLALAERFLDERAGGR